MATSWSEKPTELITSVVAEVGAVIVKEPSAAVEAPTLVPFTVTVAPWTDAPLSSVTLPEIVFVWEKAVCVKSTQSSVKLTILVSNR